MREKSIRETQKALKAEETKEGELENFAVGVEGDPKGKVDVATPYSVDNLTGLRLFVHNTYGDNRMNVYTIRNCQ